MLHLKQTTVSPQPNWQMIKPLILFSCVHAIQMQSVHKGLVGY